MIPPITREEKYIYEIVGAGETAPEKPLTRKELFYAVILGEDRTVPRPITNEEKCLAALAGTYSETLPFPTTRIEKFRAKAAGMDVETPVPVTREEIFLDNYSAVQKFEGVPPLTFKSNGKALKNYRIYGNTVGGESVGDRTGNLFDGIFLQGYWAGTDGNFVASSKWICTNKLPCKPNTTYTLSFNSANSRWYGFVWFTENGDYLLSDLVKYPQTQCYYTATSPSNAAYMAINIAGYPDNQASINPSNATDLMLVEGSTTLPYEPYGYRVPVTVNDIITNLYLTEQIKKVGAEAEYVDFEEQKQYFADGTYANVTLPEITTIVGTNTLSVDTQVQPSKVYVEVGIKTV